MDYGRLGDYFIIWREKKTNKINPKKERKISITWTLYNLNVYV